MRIVIMGGTAGIGLATARLLAAEGSEVIVTGRDPQRLTAAGNGAAAAKGGEAGGGLVAEQVDGTSEAEVAAFLGRMGAFDHLVLAFSPGSVGAGTLAATDLCACRQFHPCRSSGM
ncbi:SDR family NAD(P)-dependent oxidoreductase [Nonomuraea angiospora]|uniref:SDR family NAD(P)-dependent oxidoreductase n=1 Tax=Nonomuraea angiospora TaxID=46172 RepID=UPI0034431199